MGYKPLGWVFGGLPRSTRNEARADETDGTLEANPGGWTYIEAEGAKICNKV